MLELRPTCENCNKSLPPNSTEARICTFECTFCATCVDDILHNICPNCGGGFVNRPIRPKGHLKKYPPTEKQTFKPIDFEKFEKLLAEKKGVKPENR